MQKTEAMILLFKSLYTQENKIKCYYISKQTKSKKHKKDSTRLCAKYAWPLFIISVKALILNSSIIEGYEKKEKKHMRSWKLKLKKYK